ncbi:MAG: DUF5060 domain-containing protein [Planctomycetota bacterium]
MRYIIRTCFALLLLGGLVASAQQQGEVLFDFESTPGEWRLENGNPPEIASGLGDRAGGALVLPVSFPQDAAILFRQKKSWTGCDRISFDVFVPKDGPRDVQAMAYVVDSNHHWYQALERRWLERGKWNTVTFDISDDSDRWEFEGHFQPWDSYVKRDLCEAGIKLLSKNTYQGSAAIDNIRLYSVSKKGKVPPLQLVNFRTNQETVPLYHKFEITFNLSRSYENPFDPDQIDLRGHFISPSGKVTTVPGFFYRSYIRTMQAKGEDLWEVLTPFGCSEWKIRFTPTETGTYRFFVEVDDGDNLKTGIRSFQATPSKRPGFVQISKSDRNYFEWTNGDFFYPIGHNVTATFDERNAANLGIDLLYHRGTWAYDRYFKGMAENKETLARVWMSSWNLAIEWSPEYASHYQGLGRYSMENAWRMDYILEQAEEKGIYVAITFEPHGHWITTIKEESDWHYNPYSKEAGGELEHPAQFFLEPEAKRLYLRKLRYILARWGYSPAVFSWEIFNEIDLGHTYYAKMATQIIQWERSIAQYIKAQDQGRHLITSNRYWWDKAAYLHRQPEIEYTSAHLFGEDPIGQAKNAYRAMLPYEKIFVISELAENVYGGTRERTGEFMHVALWSSYMLPMATHGWPWWWDFIDEENLYFHFKALANFNEGEDRRGKNLQTASSPKPGERWAPGMILIAAENGSKVERVGAECLFNDQQFHAWIYDQKLIAPTYEQYPMPPRLVLAVDGLRNGVYDVEFWDTYNGVVTSRAELRVQGGPAKLALPKFEKDMALKIRPACREK